MTNEKKQYDSLGQMVFKKDYEALLAKLIQYENDETDKKILRSTGSGGHSTLVDELLYNIPRFATKLEEKVEEEEEDSMSIFGMGANPPAVQDIVVKPAELAPFVLDVVDVLLRNGANPNMALVNGITPMMLAATVNNIDLIKKLIENPFKEEDLNTGDYIYQKGDLNKKDGKGQDLLFYAAMTNSIDIMDCLVKEYNFNINRQNLFDDNKTLLHILCQNLNEETSVNIKGLDFLLDVVAHKEPAIDKLLELGVNPTIEDDYENLPEMLVPSLDESPHNTETLPEDTIKKWDDIYQKVGSYRVNYEKNNKTQFKTKF